MDCLCYRVRLPVSSRLLAVKFSGSHKLYADFQLCWGSVLLILALFRGQLNTWQVVLRGNLNRLLFWRLRPDAICSGRPFLSFLPSASGFRLRAPSPLPSPNLPTSPSPSCQHWIVHSSVSCLSPPRPPILYPLD